MSSGNKSKLEQIEKIQETGHGKNNKPLKQYTHSIYGKEFKRGLSWWAKVKTIIDPLPIEASVLYGRLEVGNKWTVRDALGAWNGETAREFRLRTGNKEAACLDIDMKSSVINTWLYGAANVS